LTLSISADVQTGDQEAAQGKKAWMLKMSEWAPHTAVKTTNQPCK
jgi:hypothetical protein